MASLPWRNSVTPLEWVGFYWVRWRTHRTLLRRRRDAGAAVGPAPPRPTDERSGYLTALARPLAPALARDQPPHPNRITVTVSNPDAQPVEQRSSTDTPLPPEATLPLQLDLVHPVVQVRDLARNLDVSCAQILPIASALGLRVSCPSTVITLEQAAQIECAYLRANPAPLEESSSQVRRTVWHASEITAK